MSTATLPALQGLGFDVVRTPKWSSNVQQNISGKEIRIAYQTFPRWEWSLQYNILRSAAAFTEFQQLAGFFNARQGMLDTFLYQDADDNAVIGQAIGTGDGSTTAFQMVRLFGGFVEPVLAPHTISTLYLNGIAVPAFAIGNPASASLTYTSGGSLGATTYYVRNTYVTNSGETTGGTETSIAVPANKVLVVNSPAAGDPSAIAWNTYVSTSPGTEQRQNASPIAIGTNWQEATSGLGALGGVPANSTGWVPNYWGTSSPGLINFNGPVHSGVAITADFTYYWPVRMTADSVPFTLFMSQYYSAKKFSFISVKN